MNRFSSERPRGGSRGPVLSLLDRDQRAEASRAVSPRAVSSPTEASETGVGRKIVEHVAQRRRRPELRVVAGEGAEPERHVARVLLAGGDAHERALLRAEFGATLAPRTRWVETDDVAGTLERAAHSRMVILAGDLEDADAESLLRMLGRRHPELPVISVDASLPAVAGVRG